MLNPNTQRLDYGDILAPPPSYSVDFAVGCTYSLDLNALVGVSVALGLSGETDSEKADPIYMLNALRRVGDKTLIFCEGGQIHAPGKITPLYALLENMVCQVWVDAEYGYPSFHPKMWLVKYTAKNLEPVYRFIVLSRNLTFDRSWDLSVVLNGSLGEKTEKNKPLQDFLKFLAGKTGAEQMEKKSRIISLAEELDNVIFETESDVFAGFEFMPTGIEGYTPQKMLPQTGKFKELLIMSPFLSNDVVKMFNDASGGKRMLITRRDALYKLNPKDCKGFKNSIYVMKNAVVDGEIDAVQKQDIHAKMYFTYDGEKSNLYVGSLNASHNAFYNNVEFMLKLTSTGRKLRLKHICADLCDDEKAPFEQVGFPEEGEAEKETEAKLDLIIKKIVRGNPFANAEKEGEGYTVTVNFDQSYENVEVCPMFLDKNMPVEEKVVFTGVKLQQLSVFYRLMVKCEGKSIKRIIIIPTTGIPQARDNEVVSRIVARSSENFYKYMYYVLDDGSEFDFVRSIAHGKTGAKGKKENVIPPALYEKMLRAAVEDKEKFKEIEFLMQSVEGDKVVPEGLKELCQTFKEAVE